MNANVYVNCRDGPSSGVDAVYKVNIIYDKTSPVESHSRVPRSEKQENHRRYIIRTLNTCFLDMYVCM